MMHYGWNEGGWGVAWMLGSWVAVAAVIVVGVGAFVRSTHPQDRPTASSTPKDLLAERFARGDIDAAEYTDRLRVLDGVVDPPKP